MATAASATAKDRQTSPVAQRRSASPPPKTAPESRAASLAPKSPVAARLTSPPPPAQQPSAAKSPSPTPAPPTPAAAPASPAPDGPADDVAQENVIDLDTFLQIVDLDEDDTHDFSLGMADAYFTQASTTFKDMDDAFASKDLRTLSSLGHFLKGSSAALGVSAVQASCERIQHYGDLRDEENNVDLTAAEALAKLGPLLQQVKKEYAVAERWLKNYYKDAAPIPA